MMERVKTRLFHKASCRLVETYMVQEAETGPMYWFKTDDGIAYAMPDEVVVMNYCGSGYVGDLVTLTNINNWYVDHKSVGIIGYDRHKFAFVFVSMDGITYPLAGKGVKVIGNVFENPELIRIRDGMAFSNMIVNAFGHAVGNSIMPHLFSKIRIDTRQVLVERYFKTQKQDMDYDQLRRSRHEHWRKVQAKEMENERKKKMNRYRIYLEVKKEIERNLKN